MAQILKHQLQLLDETPAIFGEILQQKEKTLALFYHTSCLGCTGRAIPLAYQLQQEHPALQVILIHSELAKKEVSTTQILEIFIDKKSPLPIYKDVEHHLYDLVKAEGTPHWVLFDSNANLLKSIFGSQTNAQNNLHYTLLEEI